MNLSLRPLRLAPLALVAALGATGCVVEAGFDGPAGVVAADVAEVGIDTDASLVPSAGGDGTALYVETKADGHWSIFTSCDTTTNPTHAACAFDVLITPVDDLAALDNVTGTDLTDRDNLTVTDGSIRLVTSTSTGLDGVEFDTDPGAVVEVDLLLDGVAQPRFVTWIAGGAVAQGAPANPVDFAPEAP